MTVTFAATFAAPAHAVTPWADPALSVIEGLELWLDASAQDRARKQQRQATLPHLGLLGAWYDSSSHQRHVIQHDRDARPKYMRFGEMAVARFDGADDYLTRPGIGEQQELTVFVLAAPRANPGYFRGFFSAAESGRNDYTSGVNIDMGGGASTTFETLNAEGAGFGGQFNFLRPLRRGGPFERFHIITLTIRSHEVVAHFDTRQDKRRDRKPTSLKLDTFVIGGRLFSNTKDSPFVQGFFDGDIAEVLVYSRALTAPQREEVEKYLAAKRDALHREMARGQDGFVLEPVKDAPPVQVLVPGFAVKKLPVDLTNINNVRYRPDGKLVALAYNGNVWLLSDSDGDGVEDKADLFWKNDGTVDRAIGMALTPPGYKHGQGLFFASKNSVLLVTDADGDDRADKRIVVAEGWTPSTHGVDALGVAVGPDGSVYFGRGTARFTEPYLIDSKTGNAAYNLDDERGTILKVSPDFSRREIVCTGIRYPVGMAFNRHGDLFCTDQEGATWVPNGNPFDELLHIQPGRHYGFPARHPKHLPGVIDEPSVFDYGPQHQSTCGIHFNDGVNGGPVFGPSWWAGDAIVSGESRGKLYRTKLVKTQAGYVAQNQIVAALGMLTIDACPSPDGHLVVACHSGAPDWGTGPDGKGSLYKIMYHDKQHPQPVSAWAQSPTEVRIAFDRPLVPAHLTHLAKNIAITYGTGVRAGDRFESIWPGYAIVEQQRSAMRSKLEVHSVQVSPDRRTLILATQPHPWAADYGITLPGMGRPAKSADGELPQVPAIDMDYTLNGLEATWAAAGASQETWRGWLPHLNLAVNRALTTASAEHDALWSQLEQPGRLTMRGQIDLKEMLRPAVQPGSSVDFELPPEAVTLTFRSRAPMKVNLGDQTTSSADVKGWHLATLNVSPAAGADNPLPLTVAIDSRGGDPELDVTFHTAEDDRARALPLRRLFMPWVNPQAQKQPDTVARHIPQIEGGNWVRGRELFYSHQAMCSRCHAVGDKGGHIGPDLSNLIHRDYASVFRDIEHPSAAINPDHIAYLFTLKDGRTIMGVPRSLPDGRTVIGDMAGMETTVTPEQIASMAPQPISAMPPGLNHLLGAEGMCDLMTFLLTTPLEPAKLESGSEPPSPRSRAEVQAVLDAGKADASLHPAKPMRIVLVGGAKDHGPDEHDYPNWQERWAKLLALGDNITVTAASPFPTAEQFEKADVVIFYQKGDWTSERAAMIDAYLARGGGLVYLHYAVDGGKQPQEFAKRIGLAWQGGRSKFRHGALDLSFTDHPITAGFRSPTHFVDETYWQLIGDPKDVQVLASGMEDGAAQPLIWTRTVGDDPRGQGRVFVSILGHYTWTFDDPLFRLLVLRGASWAAKQPIDRLSDLATFGARMNGAGK